MSGLPTPTSTQLTELNPAETTQVTRHAKYYKADVPDPIILRVRCGYSRSLITTLTGFNNKQVENLLYCQSFHYLAGHILFLQRMYELPPPPEGHQGKSDDDPVPLLGANGPTFDLLLSVLDLS